MSNEGGVTPADVWPRLYAARGNTSNRQRDSGHLVDLYSSSGLSTGVAAT
jgi:hypothetical protein